MDGSSGIDDGGELIACVRAKSPFCTKGASSVHFENLGCPTLLRADRVAHRSADPEHDTHDGELVDDVFRVRQGAGWSIEYGEDACVTVPAGGPLCDATHIEFSPSVVDSDV